MCILSFVNNEDTMQTSYTINRTKRVEHELLIAFHVMRIDFNKEIVVTTGVITLCYFLKNSYKSLEISWWTYVLERT